MKNPPVANPADPVPSAKPAARHRASCMVCFRVGTWMLPGVLLLLAGIIHAEELAEPNGSSGGLLFGGSATFAQTVVKEEGPRQGFQKLSARMQFGIYGLSVTQFIDPKTNFPPRKQRWGDSFVEFRGRRVQRYMVSNWHHWYFLDANISPQEDQGHLPSPTRHGRLVYVRLLSESIARVSAEAAWRDARGGYLRARFLGLRGSNLCGASLRYFPPPGKRARQVKYILRCCPYDYSDRGQWQRQRWVATPQRNLPLTAKPLAFMPAKEWRYVLFNRFGQVNAGAVLAVDPTSVKQVRMRLEKGGRGSSMMVTLVPAQAERSVVLALGDWTKTASSLARARFFANAEVATKVLRLAASCTAQPPPRPGPATDIARLLKTSTLLSREFSGILIDVRSKLLAAWTVWNQAARTGKDIDPAAMHRYNDLEHRLGKLRQRIRNQWFEQRLWNQEDKHAP